MFSLLCWCMCAGFVATMWGLFWWNQRMALRLSEAGAPLATPLVSVCIPARNEAHNLPVTLPLCMASQYPAFEILVLDDQSTDQTAAIVSAMAEGSAGQVRLLQGSPLPEGYNGKNWACQQLAQAAKGDVLLFCDADVSIGPMAISDTVSWMQRTGAGVVTAIPHQRLSTWSEKAVIPLVMHVATLGFVSLMRAFTSSMTALTVANGQWLCFSRACYRAIGGHQATKGAIVEDMELCKAAKRQGFRVCPVIAFDALSVRMYRSFAGVWEGYSKNLYGLMNYQPWIVAVVFVMFLNAAIFPWLLALVLGGSWWWLALGLVGGRLSLAVWARHPLSSVALHPVGSLLLLGMLFDSIRRYYLRQLVWKDRILHGPGLASTSPATASTATVPAGDSVPKIS